MWDQMQVFCKHISDHQIRLILHFDKKLDKEIVKNAINITVENNPIVFANYIEDKKKAIWSYSEIEIEKVFSFQESQDSDNLLKEILLKQTNTYTGPQLFITLIRTETDTLILNCNHAITDAAGVKDFMYQIAGNYSHLSRGETVLKQNHIPTRSLKVLSEKLSFKEKISVLKAMLSTKKNAPTFEKKIDLSNLQNPGYQTYTFTPVEFERIKEFGKKHTATINDILLASLYYTLQKILKNSNKTNRLQYTSDLRVFMNNADYDVLSNFSAIHNIDIDNNINGFVNLLNEISIITKARKQMIYNLADFPIMAVLFKTVPYKKLKGIFHNEFDKIKEGKSSASPGLTNTGIIDEHKMTFGTTTPIRAYMLGTINHPGLLQVAVSTYKKHLTLSIGSYYNEEVNAFISNFIEELKSTIDKEIM